MRALCSRHDAVLHCSALQLQCAGSRLHSIDYRVYRHIARLTVTDTDSVAQSRNYESLSHCICTAYVSADLDPSRFWIPYDVTHCLGMRSSLKCRKVTYKMCVAHPRKWIRFLLASTVLADLDGQNLRFCERRPVSRNRSSPHARSSTIR